MTYSNTNLFHSHLDSDPDFEYLTLFGLISEVYNTQNINKIGKYIEDIVTFED